MKTISLFLFIFLAFSCKKEDDYQGTSEPSNPDYYKFVCQVNGVEYNFTDGSATYARYSSTVGSTSNAQTNVKKLNTGAGVKKSGGAYGYISFDNNEFVLTTYNSNKNDAVASATTSGSHSYYQSGSTAKGVSVRFVDENNVVWDSKNGPQNGGSSFTVTGNYLGTEGNSRDVKGTFSCKVYNSAGSSKQITDGIFYGVFLAH